jgi:Methyltransferase domain
MAPKLSRMARGSRPQPETNPRQAVRGDCPNLSIVAGVEWNWFTPLIRRGRPLTTFQPEPDSAEEEQVDQRYYQVARPASLAERMVIVARDRIYRDFMLLARPAAASTILDVGVSDVVGEAANVLERKYPHLNQVTAVGLGSARQFQAAFPQLAYRQIAPGAPLPFADRSFDIATSNAVLEHVGSVAAQAAFVAELARVAQCAFISVPNRFFPVEHHTGIPVLHWTDASFAAACRILRKREWAESANLILMTRASLRRLCPHRTVRIGSTGIRLGPFSSNLFMLIGEPGQA